MVVGSVRIDLSRLRRFHEGRYNSNLPLAFQARTDSGVALVVFEVLERVEALSATLVELESRQGRLEGRLARIEGAIVSPAGVLERLERIEGRLDKMVGGGCDVE